MNASKLLMAELAKLTEKKGVLLSVIGVLLIPIVYVAILLSPTWSPYDNLSNLPVAVVNLDKGAVSGDDPINVGEDLVASMKESKSLGFDFVSKEKADKGMESQDYYMMIEIPEDFSERITTVLADNPQIPELRYIQNEGLNFMASQVTNSATERIREQLGNTITGTYAKNLFSQLGEIASGFKSAADGSEQLHTGSSELHDGTTTMLASLEEKAPDIDKLAAGSKELEKGTQQLLSNLTGKQGDIAKLAEGAKAANTGTTDILNNLKSKSGDIATLAKGSKDLENGTTELLSNLTFKQNDITTLAAGSKELSNGVNELLTKVTLAAPSIAQLHEGAKKLNEGGPLLQGGSDQVLGGLQNIQGKLPEFVTGSQRLVAGVGELSNSTKVLSGYSNQLTAGLSAYIEHPELATADPDFFKGLLELSKGVSRGLGTMSQKIDGGLKPGIETLANGIYNEQDDPKDPKTLKFGIDALVAGQTTLNTKIANELVPGFAQLAGGTTLLNASWNEMLVKIPVMAAGAGRIADGNQTVDTGWKTLTAGATQLNSGASQIAAGNQTVNTGWQTLTGGVTQLQAGTSQIAAGNADVNKGWQQLAAGAGQLHTGMIQVSDGTDAVQTGWGDLSEGAAKINDGVGQIEDGSSELAAGLGDGAEKTGAINAKDANIAMFSSPVKTVGEKVNGYQYYRDSTAPYIMSLALFVGMLIMTFFVDFKKPANVPLSKVSWFASKYMKLSIFAVAQALLVSIFTLLVIQLKVANPISFILFAIFVSMTFMTIIFFLVAFGGNIGRFIGLALIVAQLSITGANLPIEMLPEFYRNLSQYLPLTYSNAGFRAVISLGDISYLWANTGILFIYFACFAVLALCVFLFSGKNKQEDIGISA
jgi:putative membrane protein